MPQNILSKDFKVNISSGDCSDSTLCYSLSCKPNKNQFSFPLNISCFFKDNPEFRIDPGILAAFFQGLFSLKAEHEFIIGDNEQQLFGLSSAQLRISIESTSKRIINLEFGALHPFSSRRYAKASSSPKLLMIPEKYFTLINKNKNQLRDHNPFRFRPNQIKGFSINSGKEPSQFELRGDKWFVKKGGIEIRGDDQIINALLSNLSSIQAKELLPLQDLPKLKEAMLLSVEFKDVKNSLLLAAQIYSGHSPVKSQKIKQNKIHEVDLLNDSIPGYLVTVDRSKDVYYVSANAAFSSLFRSVSYFRNRHIFSDVDNSEVFQIKVVSNFMQQQLKVDLVKANGAWEKHTNNERDHSGLKETGIRELMQSLLGFSVLSFSNRIFFGKESDIKDNLLRIEIFISGRKEPLLILIKEAAKRLEFGDIDKEKDPEKDFISPYMGVICDNAADCFSVIASGLEVEKILQAIGQLNNEEGS